MPNKRLNWSPILDAAGVIAVGYSVPPTLRQVFYRLVAGGLIPNRETVYKQLSSRTAVGRREGWFPDFSDGTRTIEDVETFTDVSAAVDWLAGVYQLDRTRGQDRQTWVIVEKATLSTLAVSAVRRYGVPVVALRGYGSQTIIDRVARRMDNDGRPATILYVGDFDPTGEDIDRDLRERLNFSDFTFERLAVTADQIAEYELPPMPGKTSDSRAAGFVARHGVLVQVEAEAIDPNTLSALIVEAVESVVDLSTLRRVVSQEEAHRQYLRDLL